MTVPYSNRKEHIYNWFNRNPEKKRLADAKTNKKKNDWIKIQRIYLRILL